MNEVTETVAPSETVLAIVGDQLVFVPPDVARKIAEHTGDGYKVNNGYTHTNIG